MASWASKVSDETDRRLADIQSSHSLTTVDGQLSFEFLATSSVRRPNLH